MLIEIKIIIGLNSIFNIPKANFKSAHLLNKMALRYKLNATTVDGQMDGRNYKRNY